MVYRIKIRDNNKAPIRYLPDLKAFEEGKEYIFKPGVNIIVGENGCGKTTLMNLIRRYLLVDYTECDRGIYNSNINALFKSTLDSQSFYDGIDVYADYDKNTFRLSHAGEKERDQVLSTALDFATAVDQRNSSTGEGVVIAINSLFHHMFSSEAKLTFDYSQFKEGSYSEYGKYIKEHKMERDNEHTILMDEPDRNLSLENLSQIKSILSFHKEGTQVIAVIHNPLLIYSLSKMEHINFIEMTEGYVKSVIKTVDDLVK